MWSYGQNGQPTLAGAVIPEYAIGPWSLVLGIGLMDLLSVRPPHSMEFMRIQGRMAKIGSHEGEGFIHCLENHFPGRIMQGHVLLFGFGRKKDIEFQPGLPNALGLHALTDVRQGTDTAMGGILYSTLQGTQSVRVLVYPVLGNHGHWL